MTTDQELHTLLTETQSLLHVSSTGAGPTLQLDLWGMPGCSKYLVGFFTPYARTQLHSFLGHEPDESYVSMSVAYDLARASYIRSAEHQVKDQISGNPVGVGITAAVASNRMPRGEQRVFICITTKDTIYESSLTFEKATGEEARRGQDRVISKTVRDTLVQVLRDDLDLTKAKECQERALERFYRYPVFKTNGVRLPRSPGGRTLGLPPCYPQPHP